MAEKKVKVRAKASVAFRPRVGILIRIPAPYHPFNTPSTGLPCLSSSL